MSLAQSRCPYFEQCLKELREWSVDENASVLVLWVEAKDELTVEHCEQDKEGRESCGR